MPLKNMVQFGRPVHSSVLGGNSELHPRWFTMAVLGKSRWSGLVCLPAILSIERSSRFRCQSDLTIIGGWDRPHGPPIVMDDATGVFVATAITPAGQLRIGQVIMSTSLNGEWAQIIVGLMKLKERENSLKMDYMTI